MNIEDLYLFGQSKSRYLKMERVPVRRVETAAHKVRFVYILVVFLQREKLDDYVRISVTAQIANWNVFRFLDFDGQEFTADIRE